MVYMIVFLFLSQVSAENATELMLMGNYDGASEIWEELLKEEPNNIEYMYNLAVCYENMGELEKALYFYKKSRSLNPDVIDRKIESIEGMVSSYERSRDTVSVSKRDTTGMPRLKISPPYREKLRKEMKRGVTKIRKVRKGFRSNPFLILDIVLGLLFIGMLLLFLRRRLFKNRKCKEDRGWGKLLILLKNKDLVGLYTFREGRSLGAIFVDRGEVVSSYYSDIKVNYTVEGDEALKMISMMKEPEIKFIPNAKDNRVNGSKSERRRSYIFR